MMSCSIRVVSLAGNVLVGIDDVDASQQTGRHLKRRVEQLAAFPIGSVKLTLPGGSELGDDSTLAEAASAARGVPLVMQCVLAARTPLGIKFGKPFNFGSKAGMVLEQRVKGRRAFGAAQLTVRTHGNPQEAFRDEARFLIRASFAEHLAPMIDMGIEAAYSPEKFEDDGFKQLDSGAADTKMGGERAPSVRWTYEDQVSGALADMAGCHIWVRALDEPQADLADTYELRRATRGRLPDGLIHLPSGKPGRVTNAVLWRLIQGWPGGGDTGEGTVPEGSILEVLFLATTPLFREDGQAQQLMADLEEQARAAGCIAMAVAAVPHQGMSFWEKCGFTTMVPLRLFATSEDELAPQGRTQRLEAAQAEMKLRLLAWKSGEDVMEDPGSAFGVFLKQRMLLFVDTPLVAKFLVAGEQL